MVQDGRITRIDVYSKNITVHRGIHIGDDEPHVKKAYPGKVKNQFTLILAWKGNI